jgi:tetratricopeptide (TPR) repeat protein
MGMGRNRSYDRARILAGAERARRRGRARKAIALYQRVLDQEPENPGLYRKVAPLLVRRREPEEAWRHYRVAAELLVAKGFEAQASGVLREAAENLPERVEVWIELAERICVRERPIDARLVLIEGRRHFRGRRKRADAIALLRRAYVLDPNDVPIGLDLAGQLRRQGDRAQAQRLLVRLADAHPGRSRRLRFEIFRLARDRASLLAWLRALRESRRGKDRAATPRPTARRPAPALPEARRPRSFVRGSRAFSSGT